MVLAGSLFDASSVSVTLANVYDRLPSSCRVSSVKRCANRMNWGSSKTVTVTTMRILPARWWDESLEAVAISCVEASLAIFWVISANWPSLSIVANRDHEVQVLPCHEICSTRNRYWDLQLYAILDTRGILLQPNFHQQVDWSDVWIHQYHKKVWVST